MAVAALPLDIEAIKRGSQQELLRLLCFSKLLEDQCLAADDLAALLPSQADIDRLFSDATYRCDSTDPIAQSFRQYVAEFVKSLCAVSSLAGDLQADLEQMMQAMQDLLIRDPSAFTSAGHELRLLIDSLHANACGWFEGLGKSGDLFAAQFKKAASFEVVDVLSLRSNRASFEAYCQKESERTARLVRRLGDAELGFARARRADAIVTVMFNRALGGRRLPTGMSDFLYKQLYAELRLQTISKGLSIEQQDAWVSALSSLAWVFQERSVDGLSELFDKGPAIKDRIDEMLSGLCSDSFDSSEFLSQFDHNLALLMQAQAVDVADLPLLNEPDGDANIATDLSKNLLNKVENLELGQWFVHHNEAGQDVRCQLALKVADSDLMLYVNRNGQKVLLKTYAEFAYCLSSGVSKAIQHRGLFMRAQQHLVRTLFESAQKKAADIQRLKTEGRSKHIAEQEARLAAEELRLNAAEEQLRVRQAAIDKALREADQLALDKELTRSQVDQGSSEQKGATDSVVAASLNGAVESSPLLVPEVDEPDLSGADQPHDVDQPELADTKQQRVLAVKKARLQADSLNIGCWLELPGKARTRVKAKLAVKMNSTGRFIFADSLGVKVAEYQRDELVDLLSDGVAIILDEGSDFEARLSKVVKGLRKDVR